TSPRPAPPPIIQCPDSTEDQLASAEAPDFDLNRRLLDLASLAVPKVSRPKSWSPEEGRACYNPPHSHTDNVLDRSNNYAGGDNIYPKNSSEPGELLIAPSGDHERAQKANQRRANYKREHWRR
uniref:Uncharacterized protein n=1 Tax=Ciona savignyi TaxID=51511 RepID=H2Z652_CIOSA